MPVILSGATLSQIADDVPVPTYDRSTLVAGIVHFGVGGFHRSHQAMVIDQLLGEGKARDFAICGVGVLESDRRIGDVLAAQDGLYTLVVRHTNGTREARVIGSVIEYLFAPDDAEAVIEKLAAPTTRIVSLTITEGGYNIDPVTNEFVVGAPAIVADAAPNSTPATVFGLVVEGLRRRRSRGLPPFTVMSCDNIQGNGSVAAKAFSAFARLKDPEFGDWISREVSFPNTMVDRITPVTTEADREDVRAGFGIDDGWPVVCEPFFQWVIEDDFPLGRPAFEDAGAQIVEDVEPYELMKLRLLNASHQALAYFGYLAGYRFAHEAASDPALAGLLLDYMNNEATASLLPVPGVDLDEYKQSLIERFTNPAVLDTLARLCTDSSDRIPKFLLPVAQWQLGESGTGNVELTAAIVASWARYAEGVDENGAAIEVVDRLRDELVPLARSQRESPTAFIANRAIFGDLVDDARFVDPFVRALESLHRVGSQATYRALTAG